MPSIKERLVTCGTTCGVALDNSLDFVFSQIRSRWLARQAFDERGKEAGFAI
jgi:hypothetical protein